MKLYKNITQRISAPGGVKTVWLLLLILIPAWSMGQFIPGRGADSIRVTPNIAPFRTIAKLSLFSPLEAKSAIRVSIEVTLNDRWSIEPEIGIIYNNSLTAEDIISKTINPEGRLGLRYYFPEKFMTGLYIGPLVTFSTDNYESGIIRNFHPTQPDSAFYDKTNPSQYQETNYGLYVIGGVQPVISRHFNFDISGGIGVVADQTITKYNPYSGSGANLPASSWAYKFPGLVSLKAGYIF